MYVPSGVPLQGVIVHGVSEEREPYGGVSIRLEDTGASLDVHPRGPGVMPLFIAADPPVVLARDQWNCLQMQLTISASQGSARLTINGQIAAISTGSLATLPSSGYRGVSAGIVYLQTGAAAESNSSSTRSSPTPRRSHATSSCATAASRAERLHRRPTCRTRSAARLARHARPARPRAARRSLDGREAPTSSGEGAPVAAARSSVNVTWQSYKTRRPSLT